MKSPYPDPDPDRDPLGRAIPSQKRVDWLRFFVWCIMVPAVCIGGWWVAYRFTGRFIGYPGY